jgi:hypothetical protein
MKKIIFTILIFFFALPAYACSLTGQVVQGKSRICYYHCADGKRTITVSEASHCPLDVSGDPAQDPSLAVLDETFGFCPDEKIGVNQDSACDLTTPAAS